MNDNFRMYHTARMITVEIEDRDCNTLMKEKFPLEEFIATRSKISAAMDKHADKDKLLKEIYLIRENFRAEQIARAEVQEKNFDAEIHALRKKRLMESLG